MKIKLEEYWQNEITKWQSSGLSQLAYCKQNHLKPSRFSYWKKKLSIIKAANSDDYRMIKLGHISTPSQKTKESNLLEVKLLSNGKLEVNWNLEGKWNWSLFK